MPAIKRAVDAQRLIEAAGSQPACVGVIVQAPHIDVMILEARDHPAAAHMEHKHLQAYMGVIHAGELRSFELDDCVLPVPQQIR